MEASELIHSRAWKFVSSQLHEQIEKYRAALEQPGIDPVKAELFRGIIKGHRFTLSLAQPDSVNQDG